METKWYSIFAIIIWSVHFTTNILSDQSETKSFAFKSNVKNTNICINLFSLSCIQFKTLPHIQKEDTKTTCVIILHPYVHKPNAHWKTDTWMAEYNPSQAWVAQLQLQNTHLEVELKHTQNDWNSIKTLLVKSEHIQAWNCCFKFTISYYTISKTALLTYNYHH